MWTLDVWVDWSEAVARASSGAWVPDETIGTLRHPLPDGSCLYAHPELQGDTIVTPYGTKTSNAARTVLNPTDAATIYAAAHRWVDGPGAVKLARFADRQAALAAAALRLDTLAARATSLVVHLQGQGWRAVILDGPTIGSSSGDVRCYADDAGSGSLTVSIYETSIAISNAWGPPHDIEMMAASVDDWLSITDTRGI